MSREKMMKKLGLKQSDFEPHSNEADTEEALCELAEMVAAQDEALCELAELIGELING